MNAKYSKRNIDPRMMEAARNVAKEIAVEEYDKIQERTIKSFWAMFLWNMHFQLRFGNKRINEFIEGILDDYDDAVERYGVDEEGKPHSKRKTAVLRYGDICMQRLEKIGVDVDKIYKDSET